MISIRTRTPDGKIAGFECTTDDYQQARNEVLWAMSEDKHFDANKTAVLASIPGCGSNLKVKVIAHLVSKKDPTGQGGKNNE